MLSFLGRLQAGLPPYSPVFKSWIHCWKYLSVQVSRLPREIFPMLLPRDQMKWFCGLFIAWKGKVVMESSLVSREDKTNVDSWFKAFKLNFHFILERI